MLNANAVKGVALRKKLVLGISSRDQACYVLISYNDTKPYLFTTQTPIIPRHYNVIERYGLEQDCARLMSRESNLIRL